MKTGLKVRVEGNVGTGALSPDSGAGRGRGWGTQRRGSGHPSA